MTAQTDPVFAGLAKGLKPDTITVDIDALRAAERLRVIKTTERLTELTEESLAVQVRLADAAERQADALETIAGELRLRAESYPRRELLPHRLRSGRLQVRRRQYQECGR
jgi:hypothetical protein